MDQGLRILRVCIILPLFQFIKSLAFEIEGVSTNLHVGIHNNIHLDRQSETTGNIFMFKAT